MLENLISEDNITRKINDNTKKNLLIFAGGFIVGYAFKKAIDSGVIDNIKNNASTMINDYFNHEIEYIDLDEDETEVVKQDVNAEVIDVEIE